MAEQQYDTSTDNGRAELRAAMEAQEAEHGGVWLRRAPGSALITVEDPPQDRSAPGPHIPYRVSRQ